MINIKEEVDEGGLMTNDLEGVLRKVKELDDGVVFAYSNETFSLQLDLRRDDCKVFIKNEPELEINDIFDEYELQREDTFSTNVDVTIRKKSNSHSMKNFSCTNCDFWTNRTYILDNHNEMMHASQNELSAVISCEQCDYTTSNRFTLRRHLLKIHLNKEISYSCYICDFKTNNIIILPSHRACHRDTKIFSCPHCKFECFQVDTMRTHERDHLIEKSKGQLFFCAHCDYRTYVKNSLQSHVKVHSSEKPKEQFFSCSLCKFKTKRLRILKVHHRRIHLGEEPFRCHVCHLALSSGGSLNRHMKVHFKEKYSVQCSECDFKTLQYSVLKGHIKLHEKDPYKCANCNFKTRSKLHLRNHMKTHRKLYRCSLCIFKTHRKKILMQHECSESVKKPFKCAQCNKAYSLQKCFYRHLETHLNEEQKNVLNVHTDINSKEPKLFSCPHCNLSFEKRYSLQQHKIIHPKELYSCSQCNYRTSSIKVFIRHVYLHSEKRVFTCTQCGYKTMKKGDLKRHMKLKHKELLKIPTLHN